MSVIADQLRAYDGPPVEVLYADPPWFFRSRTAVISSRDARQHYEVMGRKDIEALPVRPILAADAHLFLWVTGPYLPFAFDVMKAWGFRYSGVGFVWIKMRKAHDPMQLRILPTAEADLFVGLGFTTRKNAEFCLLARRGSAKRMAKDVREVILAPVREHSRKPDEARERIERYVGEGKVMVELFGRAQAPGWAVLGNETEKFP